MGSRFTVAGLLLGIGLGGFVDGIVLHQILQWHHMLTSEGCCSATSVAGLEDNTLADGLFHAATWVCVAAGLYLLWCETSPGRSWSGRVLTGLLLVGWGAFNLVEGVIDHHLLGVHHVRTGDDETLYDLAFLACGALLVVAGLILARRPSPRPAAGRRSPA